MHAALVYVKGLVEKVHTFDTRGPVAATLYLSYEDMTGPARTVTET